jgi:hypothetical protein
MRSPSPEEFCGVGLIDGRDTAGEENISPRSDFKCSFDFSLKNDKRFADRRLDGIVPAVPRTSGPSKGKAIAPVQLAPPHGGDATAFEGQLRSTVARLRESVAEVLAAVGANLRVPHSITRDFGLDKSLASKLARVIREPDPFAAALDVPGEEAMRIFSHSMRDAGAPASSLESLRSSVESFQEMIRTHCGGDRSTLEMIVTAADTGAGKTQKQQQQLETFRRAMYRGASAVFGVQARVQVSSHYVAPNAEDPEMLDLAVVGGLVDLRRIRSDVGWAIASARAIGPDGAPAPLRNVEPIDPRSRQFGEAPLMCDFCSTPIEPLRVVDLPDGVRKFELPEGPVGSAHAVTLFTGWVQRKVVSRWRTAADEFGEHFVSLSTPAELVIHDLFVHRDLPFARRPGAFLYSQLPGGVSYPNGPRDRGMLQLSEPIQDLSGEPPRPATADVPPYSQLTRTVFTRMGHRAEDFYGVRIQVRYPPVPAILLYRYALPARPQ